MTTLTKSHHAPSFKSMVDDFWKAGHLLNKVFTDGEFLPAVNIRETKNHYKLDVAVPGFKKEDFKISTEDGLLTISAENSKEEKEEKENYTRREFSSSSFTRTFALPDNADDDEIRATYHNGLLEIELKKNGKSAAEKKAVKVN